MVEVPQEKVHLPVFASQVHGGKELRPRELNHRLINSRDLVAFLLGEVIQLVSGDDQGLCDGTSSQASMNVLNGKQQGFYSLLMLLYNHVLINEIPQKKVDRSLGEGERLVLN
ncbi:hypothetical protein L0F63_002288 [Massospora cicadina]|nr:hypothetical protein L0F63_002288 [Massospora cicadina]